MAEEGYLSGQRGALRLSASGVSTSFTCIVNNQGGVRANFALLSAGDDGAARKSICESYKSVELAS
jgi:hypothetical protein